MVTHNLKVYQKFYQALVDMSKPFEIRKGDRHYAVGDRCIFNEMKEGEWKDTPTGQEKESFGTGNKCVRQITYVLSHEMFYVVPKGYVILGLKEVL